jgi:branched-chain amino acid transport system permease protein
MSKLLFPRQVAAAVAILGVAALPLFTGNLYYVHVATTIAIYWVVVAGLNLLVGFSGQLSIGHVGLLAVGSYTLILGTMHLGVPPLPGLLLSGAVCGFIGLLLGLPSLRLSGFFFAMVTLAFGQIVADAALSEQWLTNGSMGLAAPALPAALAGELPFYALCAAIALLVTWTSRNIARSVWGSGLIAIRDADVAARSLGIPIFRAKLITFVFSGFTAGVGGGLFAILHTHITPDAFTFDLGLFFFVSIIIGGRGVIAGPFLGVAVLTAIPELVSSLAKYSTFFYGAILLAVSLLVPGGFSELIRQLVSRRTRKSVPVATDPDAAMLRKEIAEIARCP